MKHSLTIAAVLLTASAAAAQPALPSAVTPTVPSGCHATFTVADAKVLATATPNARAFVDNYGATIEATIHSQTASTANISVIAFDTKHGATEVGVYTVSLKTGRVTDDDMEPAEDDGTAAVRNKLAARHCAAK